MQHLPQPPACQLFTPIRGQARCACVTAAGEAEGWGVGGCMKGVQCPLSLLTLGPLGSGWRSCEFQSASVAFISESEMWITLDSYRWWQRARMRIKGDHYKAPWKGGQTTTPPKKKKVEMLIMSEVGRSSPAFKSLGRWRQLPLYRFLPCLLSLHLSPFFLFFL